MGHGVKYALDNFNYVRSLSFLFSHFSTPVLNFEHTHIKVNDIWFYIKFPTQKRLFHYRSTIYNNDVYKIKHKCNDYQSME